MRIPIDDLRAILVAVQEREPAADLENVSLEANDPTTAVCSWSKRKRTQ